MQINNYNDLSDFILSEHEKMSESLGLQNASKSFVRANERQLNRYQRLYSKPLYRKAKRQLKLQEALETMPHSLIWKIIHYDLWKKVKYILSQEEPTREEQAKQTNQEVMYPVIQSRALEPIESEEDKDV